MLSTSPAARATIWLVSACVHAAVFVAAGGAGLRAGAVSSAATERAADVWRAPELESDFDPPTPTPTTAPAAPVAPLARATQPVAVRPLSPKDLPIAAAAPARFALRVESGATSTAAAPVAAIAPGSDGAPLPEEGVSSSARLAGAMAPQYPPRAREAEIEADVVLSLVVTSAGDVAEARVLRPAGYGFDESALRAARIARFAPATRDGRRVAVRMRWTVSFRLR